VHADVYNGCACLLQITSRLVAKHGLEALSCKGYIEQARYHGTKLSDRINAGSDRIDTGEVP